MQFVEILVRLQLVVSCMYTCYLLSRPNLKQILNVGTFVFFLQLKLYKLRS